MRGFHKSAAGWPSILTISPPGTPPCLKRSTTASLRAGSAARQGQADRIEHARRAASWSAGPAGGRRQLHRRQGVHRTASAERPSASRCSSSLDPTQQLVGVVHQRTGRPDGAGRSLAPSAARTAHDPHALRPAGVRQNDHLRQARPDAASSTAASRCSSPPTCSVPPPSSSSSPRRAARRAGLQRSTGATDPVMRLPQRRRTGQAARHIDVVILDTAGRLHIDEKLMDELKQIDDASSRDQVSLGLRRHDRPGRGQQRQGLQRRPRTQRRHPDQARRRRPRRGGPVASRQSPACRSSSSASARSSTTSKSSIPSAWPSASWGSAAFLRWSSSPAKIDPGEMRSRRNDCEDDSPWTACRDGPSGRWAVKKMMSRMPGMGADARSDRQPRSRSPQAHPGA